MKRREFIQRTLAGSAAISLMNWSACQDPDGKRSLGKTGEKLSIIGFGGILVRDEPQSAANELVARAFEQGINYFDVAPTYGNAEEKLGPALEPYRKNAFLACKTNKRDKAGAQQELEESLRKLRTDHFDLYQLHAITTPEDVETAFGPEGAMQVFVKARQEGKVRFLGFSAHSERAALMAMQRFDFDTILFPINFVCWYKGDFGPKVVQKAKEKEMGILALKSMAHTRLAKEESRPYKKCWYRPIIDDHIADLSVRFTLSQGTTAAVPPGESPFFWKALEIAQKYQPLTKEENQEVQKLAKDVEPLFKTT
ncbi:aldo/keto reductase [candidate division KSB1 bacterium]|nr:aldo/keto reductase [candidate division KSB1 bacterium]